MKKRIFPLFLLGLLALVLTGCNDLEHQSVRFQKQLLKQLTQAENETDEVSRLLLECPDSLHYVARQSKNAYFYIYDNQNLVYWSTNWLSAANVFWNRYDRWQYARFDNAHAVYRWTRVGFYKVLTVVPVKYAYPYENTMLQNRFVKPFKIDKDIAVSRHKHNEGFAITNAEGDYLFTLVEGEEEVPQEEFTDQAKSFSYQSLLRHGAIDVDGAHKNLFLFYTLTLIFFVSLILLGIVVLIRARGWKNLAMSQKFQFIMVGMLLVTFGYVFSVTLRYVRVSYDERMSHTLAERARYVQKSLQDLSSYTTGMSSANMSRLDILVRDLCFVCEADINVYDMEGNLIGSSASQLFNSHIMSYHMASDPYFMPTKEGVYDEYICGAHYKAAYVDFLNATYVPIGFISVALYVSDAEVHEEVDHFLSQVFPLYLLVFGLCLLFGLMVTRQLTRPLLAMADKMQQFKIGQRNERLSYDRRDEVGVLVEHYNDMVDQLEVSAEKLARSERESAWRTMARQVAHEINNPLTPMRLSVQQMQRLKASGDPRFDAYFDTSTQNLIEKIDELSRNASSFSSFAKMPEVVSSNVDVAQKLYSVIQLFRNNQENVSIRYVGAELGVIAKADEQQIAQVFNNIIKNALQAIENRTDGDVIVLLKDLDDRVEISFSDNGCGIPEDVQDKVFVPNFTTKSTGTGLGMAISKKIVEGSDGDIRFETSTKGTTFFVTLVK